MALVCADEDFPGPAVKKLRDLGHDVLTAREDGRADQQIADDQVLARATQLGRAVLTHNRSHYQRLHRTDPNHAGIVSCTRDNDFDALAGRIDAAISPLDSLDGRLIKIVRPNRPPTP
jgi:hypothetical protein